MVSLQYLSTEILLSKDPFSPRKLTLLFCLHPFSNSNHTRCEEQDNLLEKMLNPPSDTPLSSSSTDISTDTEPEVDTQTAAGIAKRKAWEAKHKLKLEANKYKWSRMLTDSQKERKKLKAEEAKKLLYKFGEGGDEQTEEEKKADAAEIAAEGDDEASRIVKMKERVENTEESSASGDSMRSEVVMNVKNEFCNIEFDYPNLIAI